MSATLEKLQKLVESELEQARVELVSKEQAYFDLIEILRHIDTAYIKTLSNKDLEFLDFKLFESYRYGWISLATYYLNHIDAAQAHLSYRSNDNQKIWAQHILSWMGDLEMVNRWLVAEKAGAVAITEPEDNVFQLNFTNEIIEKEGYDRNSYDFVKQLTMRAYQGAYQRHILKYKVVKKEMLFCLRIVEDTHITYGSTPDIDRYFSKLGYYHLLKEKTSEDFGPDDPFGGLAYQKYLDVLQQVSAVAIKHLQYCELAIEKYPKVDMHNNSVYTWHEDKIISSYADYLKMPYHEVRQVFACLTFDQSNAGYYENIKGSDLPPFFKTGANQLTRTTFGVLGGGVDFLKRELKRRYRSEYDLAVNRREARFRKDIYQYFSTDRFLKTHDEIIVKTPGLHTDIDGAIFDKKTRSLGLFQLKWQDMFYTSLQERRSRISNSYEDAEKWVEKMQRWLDTTSKSDVMKKLKFNIDGQEFDQVFLFVIAHSQVHYTGLEPEPVAAWASYYQLVESYEKYKVKTNDPVRDLYVQLKMGLPSNRVKTEGYLEGISYAVNFKKFKFIFNGEANDYKATESTLEQG